MADYNIKAEITADASGFESGIKKAQKASSGLSSSVANVVKGLGKSGFVGALGAVGLAAGGVTAALGTVVKVAKQVSKTIKECTEAYKAQLIAERALDTAIQNNPFVTGASSKALKEFASEMQKVSNYGDEELIPMMTNLISLGRTETETMQIMSVAMDMSAGMGISLDTAITQLNATLNGNIGRLGQQNSELKGLTEEELKQGKAIEILGEKFKGLSGATADTSKQLKNIKGDFKEALGQFTLPSSDMWNKFWAGFYERGIEIINKINAFLDAQTIGKKITGLIGEQLKPLEYYGDRIKYLRDTMHTISDDELKAIQNYLSGLSYITDEQKQILNFAEQEVSRRNDLAEIEKKNAEIKAEKVKLQEKETAEAEKQKMAREKQASVEAAWNDKLLAQKIENLEKAREEARKNDLLEWEERLEIDSQYGDEILDLRIKQIEKEREESLNQEGITEETRKKIILYYENEITQAKADEEEKRLKRKKETNEEEVEEEKLKFSQMLAIASQYTKKMGEVFKKVANVIKNAFSKIGNFFKKMFEFNIDDALNSLLEFEDKILTFFTSTLPNLPSFFESAIGSITHLIDQLISILDFDQIASVLSSIINSVVGLVDKITKTISADPKKLTDGIVNMLKAVVDGVSNWLTNGGFKTLLDAILTIQKALEEAVIQNLPTLVDSIIDALPDLIDFFVESIKSATRTVGKIIKPLIKLVISLIFAIVELLNDQSVIDELVDTLPEIIKGIIEAIIEMLPKLLSDVLPKVLKMVLRTLFSLIPELVGGIIEGIIQAFVDADWGEIIWKMFKGFVDGIKNFFGIHSPSTMFADFGKNMIQGLWNGIKNLGNWLGSNIKKFFTKMVDGIKDCFKNIGNWFKDIFSKAWSGIKEAWGNVTNWFGDIANGIGSAFESLGSWLNGIFEKIGEWVKDAMSKVGDFFKTYGKDIGLNIATGGIYGIGSALNWWATGTNDAPKGLSIVGEAGPELVDFKGGERVYNATNTEKILAGANKGGSVFNVTFNNTKDSTAYGMMTQLKLYQRNLAFNGVL